MKKLLAIGLLSATALASTANAAGDYYAQFNIGSSAALSTRYESNINNAINYYYDGSPGPAFLFGGEIGAKVTDQFRLGLSLDYRDYSNDAEGHGYYYGYTFRTGTLETRSLVSMVNAYYDFTQGSGFNPYVTVGLGMASNEQEYKDMSRYSGFKAKTTNNFAWKIGLGGKYAMTDSFDLDIRYQFIDLGKVELGDYYSGSSTVKNTTTKSGKLRANELLLGIAYKF